MGAGTLDDQRITSAFSGQQTSTLFASDDGSTVHHGQHRPARAPDSTSSQERGRPALHLETANHAALEETSQHRDDSHQAGLLWIGVAEADNPSTGM